MASRSAPNSRRTIRTLLVLDREFETQSVDPMFLEPEAGLAWYDSEQRQASSSCSACSRPTRPRKSIAHLLGKARAPFKPARINAQFAYVGGGFGGRDHTPFPLYVALAAMFFPGRPVRLAHDRYQQFQGGIKRHAFKMRTRIGVDRATGKIQAFAADHVLDGGGLANFSANVATVGATAAIGIYDIPKVDVTTVALHSRGVTAGSMRGYGTLQTMTALEVLIDEAAAALPLDPIEFRRRNALKTGGRTMTGNPYSVSVRTPEILDKLEKHPIWQQRAQEKARAQQAGMLVGTGVACVTKDYGTGADCSLGRVEIDPRRPDRDPLRSCRDGQRHRHRARQPGGGPSRRRRRRSHGRASRHLSTRSALVTSGDPYTMDQTTQDAAEQNPRWVPAISSATSASIGAHVGTQAAAEAARVIFRFGLWPAALELWRIAPTDPRAKEWDDGALEGRAARHAGPGAAAVAGARRDGACAQFVTGAMAHGFSRWAWSRARFPVAGRTMDRAEIDALAVRRGDGKFAAPRSHQRQISADRQQPDRHHLHVDVRHAGPRRDRARHRRAAHRQGLQRARMRPGAGAGGRARAGARRLRDGRRLCACSRRCRPYEGGPGNGQWNLGQYLIARGSDLPLHDLEIEMLPPLTPDEPPKGMAEVVMIPVVPAHPERHLRRHRPPLPVPAGDPSHAQGSARVTTLSITINGRAYGPMEVRDELTMNDFLREYLGMTGTKFGCGAAQCLSCAVIVDNPDGTSYTSPTCVVSAASFDGKAIRTVEGHAKDGELSALQKAFIEHFAFQCGYCTAGFLNEGQVLLERLAKTPVARAELEKTIAEALDGHLCRCTGYIKYHEAVRDVILADPKRYLVANQ